MRAQEPRALGHHGHQEIQVAARRARLELAEKFQRPGRVPCFSRLRFQKFSVRSKHFAVHGWNSIEGLHPCELPAVNTHRGTVGRPDGTVAVSCEDGRDLARMVLRALGPVTVSGLLSTRGELNPAGQSSYGFIRIDAYASAPVVTGVVWGYALELQLPAIRQLAPPRIGRDWQIRSASVPGDVMNLFMSFAQAHVPLPPYGIGRLDPLAGIFFLGSAMVPMTGHDPLAAFALPIPADPVLVGFPLHLQALSFPTATLRPYLSNDAVGTIQV